MNKDTVTTVVGAVGAVAVAINPVLEGVTTGVLHGSDWTQLATAIVFAILGFFTNKK